MATIANLIVQLSAKDSKLRSSLNNATKSVRSFAKDAAKHIALIGGAIATLATGAFALLTRMINNQADEIDKLAKTATKLGTTVGELQKLQYQAALSGISAETLGTSLQRMVRRVSEAAQGSGVATKALQELGLSAQGLAQLKPEEQFNAIAKAMQNIGTRGDQVRLAMQIFDTEGVGLVNTFNSNLEKTGQEFESLGIRITEQQARAVEAYNDAKTKLSTIFDGLGKAITARAAEPMRRLVEYVTEFIQKSGGIDKVANAIVKFVSAMAESFITAFQTIANSIDWIIQKAKRLTNEVYGIIARLNIVGKAIAAGTTDPAVIGTVRDQYNSIRGTGESADSFFQGLRETLRQGLAANDKFQQDSGSGAFDLYKDTGIGKILGQLEESQTKVRDNYVELADSTKETADKIRLSGNAVDDFLSKMQQQAGQSELTRILGLDKKTDNKNPIHRSDQFDRLVQDIYRKTTQGVGSFTGSVNGQTKTFNETSIKDDISKLENLVSTAQRSGRNTIGMEGALAELQKFVNNKQEQKVNVNINVKADKGFLAEVTTSQELQKAVDKQIQETARNAAKTIKG
jgi:hypothetical protein